MAYQNISTPRFYVDQANWQRGADTNYATSGGVSSNFNKPIIGLRTPYMIEYSNTDTPYKHINDINMVDANNNWCAILGHTLETANAKLIIEYANKGDWYGVAIGNAIALVNNNQYDGFNLWINGSSGDYFIPESESFSHFRFSIHTKNSVDDDWDTDTFKMGCLCFGRYFDMPNAPNLSLTLSRDYGGTKEFTTHTGASMSNTMWNKPPAWGSLGAWELSNPNVSSPGRQLSRSGRRTWDLEFSYIDDGNLWGSNQMLSRNTGGVLSQSVIDLYDGTIPTGDLVDNATFQYNLINDENFFSQVWHRTLGGTLPFIFQPDNSNPNPDQFAICKFKEDSLKAEQTAFNVYDISLEIEETW
tara:strand:- start:33 stop:1109 length:1077 start_codon:yes stop_codon:yes gene_type:complete